MRYFIFIFILYHFILNTVQCWSDKISNLKISPLALELVTDIFHYFLTFYSLNNLLINQKK